MKILFISANHNPFDLHKTGSIQRTYLFLKACASFCNDIDVVSLKDDAVSDIPGCNVIFSKDISISDQDGTRQQKLRRILTFNNIEKCYPIISEAENVIDKLISKKKYDFIVIRYLPSAIKCGLLKYADRLIVDVDDSPEDEQKWLAQNACSLRSYMYHKFFAFTLRRISKRVLSGICYSFFSNPDQVYKSNSGYLPNIPFYEPDNENNRMINQSHNLLFVGDFRYEPNTKGAEHFIRNVLPLVQRQFKDVKCTLVGKPLNQEWKDKLETNNSVVVKGYVEDLFEEYKQAEVCIAPLYLGAGTNIKVLEALSMQRACVVSKFAMRGFERNLCEGKDILVAKNDSDYAKCIISLLLNPSYNERIAYSGYSTVMKHYSWSAFETQVVNVFDSLCKGKQIDEKNDISSNTSI